MKLAAQLSPRLLLCIGLWLYGLCQALPSEAAETILSFHSDIVVHPDASMTVTETLRVRAEGRAIRRGIYRDFPTRYKDAHNANVIVDFEVLSVTRDGQAEGWHQEKLSNGVRTYFGRSAYLLPVPAVYEYQLRYRTAHQLGFYPEHDELYWNVTGNAWDFPIQQASAVVQLPEQIPRDAIKLSAYTGYQGERGQAVSNEIAADGSLSWVTTQVLMPAEGLSIVAEWPKGYFVEPSFIDKLSRYLQQNLVVLMISAGLLLVFLYYFIAWLWVGRDPKAGVIIPRYAPPIDSSPGVLRTILLMGYDKRAYTADLLNLAVRGYLRIKEVGNSYSLEKLKKGPKPDAGTVSRKLSSAEQRLFTGLLGKRQRLALQNTQHEIISAAESKHKAQILLETQKIYFNSNRAWLVPGIVLSIIALIAMVLVSEAQVWFLILFSSIWLPVWGGVASLMFLNSLRGKAYGELLISLFLLGIALVPVGFLLLVAPWSLVLGLLILLAINVLFFELMKAPTRAGRKLMDEIEGFREYLSVAEQDDLAMRHPPEKTAELFERYLPYAVALGVENRWAEQFVSVLAHAAAAGHQTVWYTGSYDFSSEQQVSGLMQSVGQSLASTVTSAGMAPGSSSGSSGGFSSGGGGFSGGGGGGGGGGGW